MLDKPDCIRYSQKAAPGRAVAEPAPPMQPGGSEGKRAMRILGLDVGSKTIGMAVSDELELVANTLATLQRKGMEQDLRNLAAVIAAEGVGAIVVGLPKNMNGSLGPSAEMVLELVEELTRTLAQPVITWDERLSTVAAEKALLEADMSRKKRKKVIDQVAAALILQGYLDSRAYLKDRS